jgi:hypothetical protein
VIDILSYLFVPEAKPKNKFQSDEKQQKTRFILFAQETHKIFFFVQHFCIFLELNGSFNLHENCRKRDKNLTRLSGLLKLAN